MDYLVFISGGNLPSGTLVGVEASKLISLSI